LAICSISIAEQNAIIAMFHKQRGGVRILESLSCFLVLDQVARQILFFGLHTVVISGAEKAIENCGSYRQSCTGLS
jgi:hypothetical protein